MYGHCEFIETNVAEPRQPVDYSKCQIQNDKLIIFGTKYISNLEIKKYFDENPSIKKVRQINDSATIVEFESVESLHEALRSKLREGP